MHTPSSSPESPSATPGVWRWRLAQRLEARWWRRYLRGRSADAYLDWKRGYWTEFLARIGNGIPAPGECVLDAGCGPAGIFLVLDACEVHAVDPLLGRYRREFPELLAAAPPAVRFEERRIEALDAAARFDRIYCLNALNHVHDLHAAAAALVRAARPEAPLYVSVDAHRSTAARRLFRCAPVDVLHPQQHTLPEYEEVFRALGCTVRHRMHIQRRPFFDYVLLTLTAPPGPLRST